LAVVVSWRLPDGWPKELVSPELASYGLGPRLACIASMVPHGKTAVDVGTDHGLLPIALVGSGRCPRAIAIDQNASPLARAASAAKRRAVQLDLRLGNGLEIEPGEAEVAIMAGIGGRNIIEMVEARSPVELGIERIVVQPNTDFEEIRRVLAKLGYASAIERFVADDDRFFLVMAFDRAAPRELSLAEAFLGRVSGDPLFGAWAEIQRGYWSKKVGVPAAEERLALLVR
jgi:tRNA (adenine22-N1)-methyltransferase